MELLNKIREGEIESYEWFYFLALALVLAFGTIQTTGTTLGTERPVVSVISCSMYPVYNVGDILVVNGQNYDDIEVGDVAIYRVPKRVEFSVEGNSYTLEKDSPIYNSSVQTSVGEIKLLEVKTGKRGNLALLSVGGEKQRFAAGMDREGVSVSSVSGQSVPIVHRVVSKSNSSLQTKGDANERMLEFEESIRPYQIYGTTAFRIPRLGAIKILAMDLIGFNGDKPLVFDNTNMCG